MDKVKYLQLKEQRSKQEQQKERQLCLRCFRAEERCFCSLIKPFDPGMVFIILMHPMEARRERTGTGRLAHLCLRDSRIIEGIDFTDSGAVNQLIADPQYYPMVLYPGQSAHNISEKKLEPEKFSGKIPLVFVIDGTWPCAKKMMKLSKNLHSLPRICFTPDKPSLFEVKMQPNPMCLSTIESIHFLLNEWRKKSDEPLYSDRSHDNLIDVFLHMVDFQKKCALDPNLPSYRQGEYRPPEMRRPSKKWEKYNLFFE